MQYLRLLWHKRNLFKSFASSYVEPHTGEGPASRNASGSSCTSMQNRMKTFEDYEKAQSSLDLIRPRPGMDRLIHMALALAGEVGEVLGTIKARYYREEPTQTVDLTEVSRLEILYELGDCLWYLTAMARILGFSLQETAELNILKLEKRRKAGKNERE